MNPSSMRRRAWRSFAIAAVFFSPTLVWGAAPPKPAIITEIHGAGSTFVQPILSEWANSWSAESGIKLTYEGGGSGVGITKAKAGQVDFGATDAPLAEEDLARNNLVQFPIVAGAIVIVENVSGLVQGRWLQVNGRTLADIFMGKITRWNDAALAALNPDAASPDAAIAVVHRSEGSGTTYHFSAHLAKVSSDWAAKLGTAKSITGPSAPARRAIKTWPI